jgi:hypothetical protein
MLTGAGTETGDGEGLEKVKARDGCCTVTAIAPSAEDDGNILCLSLGDGADEVTGSILVTVTGEATTASWD